MGITVDGFDLDASAYRVSAVGWASTPDVRGSNPTLANRHGSLYLPDKVFGDSSFALKMWVDGSDPVTGALPDSLVAEQANYQAHLDVLRRLFTRRTGLLDVRIPMPDGSVRRAYAEAASAITFDVSDGAADADFAVAFTIPDVFWHDPETITQSFGGLHDASEIVVTSLDGATAPIEDTQITVMGPCPNPKLTDLGSGSWVKYAEVLGAGQSITFDSSTWAISTVGPAVDYSKLTHHGAARLLAITPAEGGPVLRLNSSGATNATVTVTGRRKYIAA